MVASSILLNGGSTLWTLLGVCRDPVARLAVVVALLDPLLDEVAPDGVVPVLAAGEAEGVAAGALHWLRLNMLHLDRVAAVRTRAPAQQPSTKDVKTVATSQYFQGPVALDKAVGDEMLVLQLDPGVGDKGHHRLVVDDDLTAARALDHLARPLVHDLGGEVLCPAGGAIQVTTLKTWKTLFNLFNHTRKCYYIHTNPASWLSAETNSRYHIPLLVSLSSSSVQASS